MIGSQLNSQKRLKCYCPKPKIHAYHFREKPDRLLQISATVPTPKIRRSNFFKAPILVSIYFCLANVLMKLHVEFRQIHKRTTVAWIMSNDKSRPTMPVVKIRPPTALRMYLERLYLTYNPKYIPMWPIKMSRGYRKMSCTIAL